MENDIILAKVLERHERFKKVIPYQQKEVEDIFKEIYEEYAKERGIDLETIRTAVVSQFRFVRDIMKLCKKPLEEGFNIDMYKSIKTTFGIFKPKKTFLRKYK